jgi:hypothetical protein
MVNKRVLRYDTRYESKIVFILYFLNKKNLTTFNFLNNKISFKKILKIIIRKILKA